MQLKKARFAALCGVSRPTVGEAVKKGKLNESSGLIDLDDPVNLAYVMKHAADKASEYQHTGSISGVVDRASATDRPPPKPDTTPKRATRQTMAKKLATIRAEENHEDDPFDPMAGLTLSGGVKRRAAAAPSGDDDGPNLEGLTEAEVAETLRKPLYDAQKAKNDAALKALELDKRNGTLIELEVVMEYMTRLATAIQTGFLDVIPKQALMICSRLGTVGREEEVEDLIADDNSRRIEAVKHIVEEMARAKWGIKNRHVIKDDESEDDTE